MLDIGFELGVTASGRAFRRFAPRADNLTQYELANTSVVA